MNFSMRTDGRTDVTKLIVAFRVLLQWLIKLKEEKHCLFRFCLYKFYRILLLALCGNSNTSVTNGKVESTFQQ